VGGLIVAWPACLPELLALWLIVLTTTGYVSVATMLAAIALLPLAWVQGARDFDPRLPFALAAGVFIVFTHRANITRLLEGTEHRFERARVLWRARRRKSRK
jgi:glycerol-3-phosphate acyltransferase PlsY